MQARSIPFAPLAPVARVALGALALSTAVLTAAPAHAEIAADDAARLDAVLADPRRDGDRARDAFRHPKETLEFFGITPDMEVVDVTPDGGWYTRVLLPYVTPEGGYWGLHYSVEHAEGMSRNGPTEEDRERQRTWPERWMATAGEDGPEGGALKGGFLFGGAPDEIRGQADAVLFFRALHHLSRSGALDSAAEGAFEVVAPGGIVGVVQHAAKETTPADYDVVGNRGYLREDDVVAAFERAGFVLEARSDINANPLDPADHEGGVWAMPPVGGGGEATADLGESNRMTLRFRKPDA